MIKYNIVQTHCLNWKNRCKSTKLVIVKNFSNVYDYKNFTYTEKICISTKLGFSNYRNLTANKLEFYQ